MSAFNDEEILITFEELKHLEIGDISLCVSKCNALKICKNSVSKPNNTYNLWAQKLFKAYDLKEFTNKDWQNIFEYLGNVLNKFVENLNSLSDTSIKELNIWWLDTQELLKCLESIIISLNVCILSIILTFVLEIILKTCKFTEKRNMKPILTIQQLVINMINNCMFTMPISDIKDFEGFNKVISSLCDVGVLICSADIKTSIETWRVVAKLSDRCNNCYTNLPELQTDLHSKLLKSSWHKNAIFGVLKESSNILKLFIQEDSTANNDNILQVAQFYLKLLKVVIKNASDGIDKFPAIKEFFELYTLCSHNQFEPNKIYKINFFVKPGLYEIFSYIYQQPAITEQILCHLKNDVDYISSYDLIQNYLHIVIQHSRKDLKYVNTIVGVLMSLYDNLFEGSLIFIDCDKYSIILEYYVTLTILDTTNEMHKQLCKDVVNSKWIKAYASADILRVYYSFIFKNQTTEKNLPCLQYWLNLWNKLNSSTSTFRRQTFLVVSLLKTMLHNMPDNMVQQNGNNLESIEIIMLICSKKSAQLQQYFETNLIKNLRKMQEYQIDQNAYRELINLLIICPLNTDWINTSVKENLVKTFTGLFAVSPSEIHRFSEFLNGCFNIFSNLNDKNLIHNVLHCLMDHLQHIENIWSVYLIDFLLTHRPQSIYVLQLLKSAELKQIRNLMDCKSLVGCTNTAIDLQVFRDLDKSIKQVNTSDIIDIKPITKKLRLGECKFSNTKFILNELNLQTQHLLNLEPANFDTTDYELLNVIKNNIEKCLRK